MYQQLAKNLYLVHNGKEYNDVWDARWAEVFPTPEEFKDPHRILDDVELAYPNRTELMADYPILVAFDNMEPTIIPIDKVVGGLGERYIIDFMPVHKSVLGLRTDKVSIRLHKVHVEHRLSSVLRANQHLIPDSQKGTIDIDLANLDITDLVVKMEYGEPVYVFNHYDFLHAIPELAKYTDTIKWKLAFSLIINDVEYHLEAE